MPTIINFDALKAQHDEAKRLGPKSGAWLRFAITMMDSFPALYQTAKGMNARMSSLEAALRDLLAQIELHTNCMDGRIDRETLDQQIEVAEVLVGSWPDFKPDFPTTSEKGEPA